MAEWNKKKEEQPMADFAREWGVLVVALLVALLIGFAQATPQDRKIFAAIGAGIRATSSLLFIGTILAAGAWWWITQTTSSREAEARGMLFISIISIMVVIVLVGALMQGVKATMEDTNKAFQGINADMR